MIHKSLKKDMTDKKKSYDFKFKTLRRQATANPIEEANDKSKALWSIINSERESTNNTQVTMELNIDGAKIQDPNLTANHLNIFFTNTANDLPEYLAEYNETLMYADDAVLLLSEKLPDKLEMAIYASTLQLQRGTDRHKYNTRQASNLTLPTHHLTIFEEKPSYLGPKFLNLLPKAANGEGVHSMRRRLTTWLLDRPFYTIQEFLNWRTSPIDL
ncbi:hypothetical protein J6590_065735 [Homalodisca vitripennis]|nr:hypothetical protein J6590_065735 [Homalodisca vitripennis]